MTAFAKNDRAFLIQCWNRKGKVMIQPVIVMSCGKKQMTLVHAETNEMLGRNFKPTFAQLNFDTMFVGTREDAEAKALEVAETIRQHEIAQYQRVLDNNVGSPGYQKAMREHLAEVTAATPSFIWK